MNSMEIGYFVQGLKTFLQSTRTTQEDFAEGVCSKVNLSNVLRGSSGTSAKMRQALAKKAGLSVEEIVELGQKVHNGATEQHSDGQKNRRPLDKEFTSELVADMSSLEILGYVSQLANTSIEVGMQSNKQVRDIVLALTQQRDDLIRRLANHRATLNALEQPIMVVDCGLKVVECNRAATETKGAYPGNAVTEHVDVIKRVLSSGKATAIRNGDDSEVEFFYPVLNESGYTKHVVNLSRVAPPPPSQT